MRRWSSIHLDTRRLSCGTSFPGSAKRKFRGWRRRAEIVRRKVDDDRLPRMWLLRIRLFRVAVDLLPEGQRVAPAWPT